MPNIYDPNFNKNVVEVYTEEPGFTGFKGLDWRKLDSIEDILTGAAGTFGPNTYLSGILDNTTSIDNNTTSIDNKLFITGDPYPAGVQGTIVFQADLTQQFDAVTTFPEQSTGINNHSVGTSNTQVLNYNVYRRELFIQNLATGTLYVKYGSSAASNSSFNFILAGCTSQDAGDGGSLSDQSYVGDINVYSQTPRYIAWERTNIAKEPLI
jgi:hypothetical protein